MIHALPKSPVADDHAQVALGFALLSDDEIAKQTDAGSFSRGKTYFRGRRIYNGVRRGATLRARCRGSSGGPYHVEATLATLDQTARTNPVSFLCNCPRGGFCKHVVALLLTWIDNPDAFEVRPPLAEVLAEKSKEELIGAIELFLKVNPDLERLLELPTPIAAPPSDAPIDERGHPAADRGRVAGSQRVRGLRRIPRLRPRRALRRVQRILRGIRRLSRARPSRAGAADRPRRGARGWGVLAKRFSPGRGHYRGSGAYPRVVRPGKRRPRDGPHSGGCRSGRVFRSTVRLAGRSAVVNERTCPVDWRHIDQLGDQLRRQTWTWRLSVRAPLRAAPRTKSSWPWRCESAR